MDILGYIGIAKIKDGVDMMKDRKFKVSENMIMWAFRYALGRRTYAVGDVVGQLKEHWNRLKPFTRNKIQEEIREAIRDRCIGDKCDSESWQEILELEK